MKKAVFIEYGLFLVTLLACHFVEFNVPGISRHALNVCGTAHPCFNSMFVVWFI